MRARRTCRARHKRDSTCVASVTSFKSSGISVQSVRQNTRKYRGNHSKSEQRMVEGCQDLPKQRRAVENNAHSVLKARVGRGAEEEHGVVAKYDRPEYYGGPNNQTRWKHKWRWHTRGCAWDMIASTCGAQASFCNFCNDERGALNSAAHRPQIGETI